MKKIFFALAFLLFPINLYAATFTGPVVANGIREATVATLPTSGLNTTSVRIVTDGNTAGDCTVGGGSTRVLCNWNGSAWTVFPSGGVGSFDPLIIPGKATPATAAGSLTRDTDNGILFMGDGTNAKCPEEKSQGILIDKCWGAAANGTTDDSTAWQSMLTALETTGGTIISTGQSLITTTLTWHGTDLGNLYIKGVAQNSGFKWGGTLGGTIFHNSLLAETKGTIHIFNMRWTSTGAGNRAGEAIRLTSSGSDEIYHNKFDDVTDAIVLNGVLLSKIDFNRFDAVKQDAVVLTCESCDRGNNQIWIRNNEFSYCGQYCIHPKGLSTVDTLTITENSFEGHIAGVSLGTIRLYKVLGAIVEKNRFEDTCGGYGADFRSIFIESTAQATISQNSFGHCGTGADYYIEFVNGTDASSGIRFIGNMYINTGLLGNIKVNAGVGQGEGFYSIGDDLNRDVNAAIQGDTAQEFVVIGYNNTIIDAHNIRLLRPAAANNLTGLHVFELSSKHFAVKPNEVVPTSGTWRKGDFVYSTLSSLAPGTIVDEPLMWWVVTAGTMGTLGAETGGITTGTTTLTMDAPSSLAVGDMITIAGVSGVKTITVKTSTTVFTIDSAANATVSGAAVAYSAAVWEPIYPVFRATPASAGATGAVGMQAIDDNYHYWYTGSAWKRAPNIWNLTASKCVETDGSGNLVSAADVCGSGGSGLTHPQVMGRISIGF